MREALTARAQLDFVRGKVDSAAQSWKRAFEQLPPMGVNRFGGLVR
ncbi:hypothetical protein [Streptomyces sp. NPDC051677]